LAVKVWSDEAGPRASKEPGVGDFYTVDLFRLKDFPARRRNMSSRLRLMKTGSSSRASCIMDWQERGFFEVNPRKVYGLIYCRASHFIDWLGITFKP
jgi:hypothetical protein